MISFYCELKFIAMIPQYGDTQPKPGREDELNRREKEAKQRKKYFEENFEMVDLDGGSWTIQVPRRINKEKSDK